MPATGGTPKPMAGGAGRGGGGGGGRGGGGTWLDATHTISTRTSNNGKTRTTEAVDINGGTAKVLHEETADEVLQSGEHDEHGDLARPSLAALHERRDRLGSDLRRVDVRRRRRLQTHEGARRALARRVVARQQAHRVGREHGRRSRARDRSRSRRSATIPSTATIVTVTSGSGTNTSPQWSPDDKRSLLSAHGRAEFRRPLRRRRGRQRQGRRG